MQDLLNDRLFEDVMEMAGFYAAEGLLGASSGEILMPIVGYQGRNGERRMERLIMGSIDAVAVGEMKISKLGDQYAGAVLVKDGLVTLSSGKTDCLLVDVRFNDGGDRHLKLVIPYRNANHAQGFAVHTPFVATWQGVAEELKPVFLGAFQAGLKSHEQGFALWKASYLEQAGESSGFQGQEPSQFSQEEFESLRLAPFLVFFQVACSDGKLDKKEVAKFIELLSEGNKYENPLLNRVITNVISDIPAMLNAVFEQERDTSSLMLEVRKVVDARAGSEAGEAFAHALLAMGRDIASASGGFFGFGSKISKDERMALAHLAVCLGLMDLART